MPYRQRCPQICVFHPPYRVSPCWILQNKWAMELSIYCSSLPLSCLFNFRPLYLIIRNIRISSVTSYSTTSHSNDSFCLSVIGHWSCVVVLYFLLKMAVLESYHGYFLWNYVPSLAGAIVFVFLFLTTSAFQFWRLFKTNAKFCWPFALGCLCTYFFLDYIATDKMILDYKSSFITSISWGHWLLCKSCICQQDRKIDAIHFPKLLYPSCSSAFRSIYLHDTWPDHALCPRRTPLHFSHHLAHKGFRNWRYNVIHGSRRGWCSAPARLRLEKILSSLVYLFRPSHLDCSSSWQLFFDFAWANFRHGLLAIPRLHGSKHFTCSTLLAFWFWLGSSSALSSTYRAKLDTPWSTNGHFTLSTPTQCLSSLWFSISDIPASYQRLQQQMRSRRTYSSVGLQS